MSSIASRNAALVVAGAVAVLAISASPAGDQGFPLIVLLGPVLTGAIAARRRVSWRPVAAAWALSGVLMLAVDWALNGEDELFHLLLAALMAALTALGAAIGRTMRRGPRRAAG